MRIVIQRVTTAKVEVNQRLISEIGHGLLVLLGVKENDNDEDVKYLAEKTVNLRIFEDKNGKMNLSVRDTGGSILIVSQFTLYADTKRGRRPCFSEASRPSVAEELYLRFINTVSEYNVPVASGQFGAMMDVSLVNGGPVTIIIDSKQAVEKGA